MNANERDRMHSRLPEDPSYWDGLARRIAAESSDLLAGYRDRGAPWWSSMARLSPALAASAILVAGAAWLYLPQAGAAPASAPTSVVERALRPDDPLAGRFLAGEQAPDVASLLVALGAVEGS